MLKAMARDASARYASAAELADDLRCFLENRPIQARRRSAVERFRRWCRRNPAVASLTGAVVLLLVLVTVVSVTAALQYRAQLDQVASAEQGKRRPSKRRWPSSGARTWPRRGRGG